MTKRKRENRAVTADGARYNKLQRPNTLIAPPVQLPEHDEEPYHKLSRSDAPLAEEPESGEDCDEEQDKEPSTPDRKPPSRQPRPDPTYGQRSFLPGLDESADEESDTYEALAYLRSVRTEAAFIPNLLVAPKPTVPEGEFDASIYDTGYGDSRGYYADGAYIAAPTLGPILPPSAQPSASPASASPQAAYRTRLLARFHRQRAILQATPPASAIAALAPTQFISLPQGNNAAFREWRSSLESSPPSPVQLAAMDSRTVFRALALLTSVLRRDRNISARVSAWAWGLLTRLPELGTLGSEEVGVVRELGKRAVWVRCGFVSREIAELTEGFGGEVDEDYVERRPRHEVERERMEAERDVEESGDPSPSKSLTETEEEEASRRNSSSSLPDPLPEVVDMSIADAIGLNDPSITPSHRATRQRIVDILEGLAGPPPIVATLGDVIKIYHPTVGEIIIPKKRSLAEMMRDLKDRRAARLKEGAENEDEGSAEASPSQGEAEGETGDVEDMEEAVEAAEPEEGEIGDEEEQEVPDANTEATLDMIITIAGELYGQKDLLEFRDVWAGPGDGKDDKE
ncbi:hypothetical protein H2201_004048 [Coniosporium apollinis]|uniref:Uncharacterized protein n=1 Tax=Coniosporium apollinis TaxID=61459 RepID=A0ABQ9NU21_9PEZI|nr:hypothetical protein H2201_004048 [Coniosporium apollinis]